MTDQPETNAAYLADSNEPGFTWHPHYRGRSFARVHGDLVEDIGRDQRSYKLAMDGAEGAEHDSLTTIVELERRWSIFEFDWAEMDPKELADRILKFEQERERRQETISFSDYRASGALAASSSPAASRNSRRLTLNPTILAIAAIMVVVVVVVLVFTVMM